MNERFLKASHILESMRIDLPDPFMAVKVRSIRVHPMYAGFTAHSHSFFEAHYIAEGAGTVKSAGKTYRLRPGAFFMTGPGVMHEQHHSETVPTFEYAFHIDLHVTGDTSEPMVAEYRALLGALAITRVVHDREGVFRKMYESILEEALVGRPGYLTRIRGGVWNLLVIAARLLAPAMKAAYPMPRQDLAAFRMEQIDNYILDNMVRPVVAGEIARQLALGEKQLGRLVRSSAGMSLHEYVLSKKIAKAISLIRTTGEKLATIAGITGFSSAFHLSRAVKKATGTSPSAFRK